MDWDAAKAWADSLGPDVELATIRSQVESAWLTSTVTATTVWIGFTDEVQEGTWVWRSGEPVTYTNWMWAEPDDAPPGQDACSFSWRVAGAFADNYTWQSYPAIIEWIPPIGPQLAKSGACPGSVSLSITGASPNGLVGILYGPAGTFTKSGPPCAGLSVDIASPTLGALIPADGAGNAALNFRAPPGACGRSVQGVDIASCSATNTITL